MDPETWKSLGRLHKLILTALSSFAKATLKPLTKQELWLMCTAQLEIMYDVQLYNYTHTAHIVRVQTTDPAAAFISTFKTHTVPLNFM